MRTATDTTQQTRRGPTHAKRTTNAKLTAPVALTALLGLLASVLALVGGLSANPATAQSQGQSSQGQNRFVASVFHPIVSFEIPWLDDNGDRNHDLENTQIVITIKPASYASPGCSPSMKQIFDVPSSGVLGSRPLGLPVVDRPAVAAFGFEPRCVYAVSFRRLPNLVGWARPDTAVSAAEPEITIAYRATKTRSFTPSVNIAVPQTDANNDGTNDFAGASFAVTFAKQRNMPAGCSAPARGTYVVGDDGRVVLSGAEPRLVYLAAGQSSLCSYNVGWPDVRGFALQPGATRSIGITRPDAAAVYDAVVIPEPAPAPEPPADPASDPEPAPAAPVHPMFTPSVSVYVPKATNYHAPVTARNTRVQVTFTPEPGSHEDCSAATSMTFLVERYGHARRLVSEPNLVAQPAGTNQRCVYLMGWPELADFALQPGATPSIHTQSARAIGEYHTARLTYFIPRVYITVPQVDADRDGVNDYASTRFYIVFRGSEQNVDACDDIYWATFVVRDSGVVNSYGTTTSLMSSPRGTNAWCAYDVEWPAVTGKWPTYTGLELQPGASTWIREGSGSISARYLAEGSGSGAGSTPSVGSTPIPEPSSNPAPTSTPAPTSGTTFSPKVAISIPQQDADRNGSNDYAGTSFTITFKRAVSSDLDCSDPVSVTYEVQASGSVVMSSLGASVSGSSGASVSGQPAAAPSLIDRPFGLDTRCRYAVTWPQATALTLRPGATPRVQAARPNAEADYAPADVRFVASVGISVPRTDEDGDGANDHAGASFAVAFSPAAGSVAGCSAQVSGTYVVQDSGGIVGDTLVLIDRPAGQVSSCVYDVGWPTVAGLELQAGATDSVRASERTAVAYYVVAGPGSGSGPTYVAVEPEIAVPDDVAQPDDTANDPADNPAQPQPDTATPQAGVIQLTRGWEMLSFNGPSGMTPADFAEALENSISSAWVWDAVGQQWRGWTASRGTLGLTSLEPGDVVMVNVPLGGVVVYSPADLLGHPAGTNSWTLAPTGISLVVYGGGSATSASDVFASYANSAVVVYLWDSQNQRWEYHLPGRQPLSAVQVPWFTDINPGDAMFVYNISPTAVTIPWQ